MKKEMEACPQFISCSAPVCPLYIYPSKDFETLPGEPTCKMKKSIRMKLGKDLPLKGMTVREYGHWKAMQGVYRDREERGKVFSP